MYVQLEFHFSSQSFILPKTLQFSRFNMQVIMVRTAIKVNIIQGRLTGGSHLENAAHLSYVSIKCTKKKKFNLVQTIYALLFSSY